MRKFLSLCHRTSVKFSFLYSYQFFTWYQSDRPKKMCYNAKCRPVWLLNLNLMFLRSSRFLSFAHLKEIRSTRLILVIVAAHVILSTPGNIVYIIWISDKDFWTRENMKGTEYYVSLAHIFYTMNYSVNFMLYCVGNRLVRKETWLMFREMKQKMMSRKSTMMEAILRS